MDTRPTPTPPPLRRTSCSSCGARVRWATTAAGRAIPLDPDPVPAGTRGALVLIGERAHGLVDAVQRIQQMFGYADPDAVTTAHEYPWHVAHFATCPRAHEHRRSRR